jgi:predicted transcriptional regulator
LVLASARNETGRRDRVPAALVDQIGQQLITVDFDDVRGQVRASERQVETPVKDVLATREYQRQAGDLRKVNWPGRN